MARFHHAILVLLLALAIGCTGGKGDKNKNQDVPKSAEPAAK